MHSGFDLNPNKKGQSTESLTNRLQGLELWGFIPRQSSSIFGIQQGLLAKRNGPINLDAWVTPR